MFYEWNAAKARDNFRKHGLTFDEAASVFLDPLALTFADPFHSSEERREISIGYSKRHRVVFVSQCRRGNRVRIISARKATNGERRQYEEGFNKEIE